MRTLIIAIAALAFLAAPAMAEVGEERVCDVKLTIESYVSMGFAGEVTVVATTVDDETTGTVAGWGDVRANVLTAISAEIVRTGTIGTWTIQELAIDDDYDTVPERTIPGTTATIGGNTAVLGRSVFAVTVKVADVPLTDGIMTAVKQAELTITVAPAA